MDQKPANLLIYYGWLNPFNSSENGWDNEKVSQDLAKYDLIVLGNGLADPNHGDFSNTQVIIPRVKALNPGTKIFGYVTTNQSYNDFCTKVDQWESLEVDGIFFDEAGYDYGTVQTNGREAVNQKVDYVHGQTFAKLCFMNAWNPDHIVGLENDPSYPNTTWNSNLVDAHLTSSDWCLMESFAVNTDSYTGTGGYEDKSTWKARGEKFVDRRETFGLNLAGSGIVNNSNSNATKLFNFGFVSSVMFGLDAFGTSDSYYGASSAAVKFFERPVTTGTGLVQENISVQEDVNDSDVFLRFVENAKFLLDFSSGAQLSKVTLLNSSVPKGVIWMWSGLLKDIPLGWVICDGTNGTPDLREKFIKGSANGVDPGTTGGSATHTHNDHPATDTSQSDVGSSKRGTTSDTLTQKVHKHTVPTLAHSTENNEPTYYSLAFIMRL